MAKLKKHIDAQVDGFEGVSAEQWFAFAPKATIKTIVEKAPEAVAEQLAASEQGLRAIESALTIEQVEAMLARRKQS